MISIAYRDKIEDIKDVWEKEKMPWIHALDDKLYKKWRLKGVPTTFIVAPDGKVIDIVLGSMTLKELESYASKLFPKKAK